MAPLSINPSSHLEGPNTKSASSTKNDETKEEKILHATDKDVLCGRGKGIRYHPGNVMFNQLLKDNYDDYQITRKGNKSAVVRRVIKLVRTEKKGRFLEDKGDHFVDIGDVRAVLKTAQAFRDLRVTDEQQRQRRKTNVCTCCGKRKAPDHDDDQVATHPCKPRMQNGIRRPTFQERIAMLHRQVERDDEGESSSSDVEKADADVNQNQTNYDDVSDTETEDSFPIRCSGL